MASLWLPTGELFAALLPFPAFLATSLLSNLTASGVAKMHSELELFALKLAYISFAMTVFVLVVVFFRHFFAYNADLR